MFEKDYSLDSALDIACDSYFYDVAGYWNSKQRNIDKNEQTISFKSFFLEDTVPENIMKICNDLNKDFYEYLYAHYWLDELYGSNAIIVCVELVNSSLCKSEAVVLLKIVGKYRGPRDLNTIKD